MHLDLVACSHAGVLSVLSTVASLEDNDRHLIVARVSGEVDKVTADLVGRGSAQVSIDNGCVVAVAKARILRLIAYDDDRTRLGQLFDR